MPVVVLVLIAFPYTGLLVVSLQRTSTRYCSMANALAFTGQGVLSFQAPPQGQSPACGAARNLPPEAQPPFLDRLISWTYYRPSMNLVLTLTQDDTRGTP